MNDTDPETPAGVTCAVSVTASPKIGADGIALMSVVVVEVRVVVKTAEQLRAADMVTLPSEQSVSPLQARKKDPAAGVTVNETTCPDKNGALQVAPQLIPAGLLVIVPPPVPLLFTVSRLVGVELRMKVAVQLRACDITTLPLAQSVSPVHPTNSDPAAGAAVKTTSCSNANSALQLVPQLRNGGLLVTAPLPLPALWIDSVFVSPGIPSITPTLLELKSAVTTSVRPSPLKSPTATA
jgi:hypothetical protein